VKVFYRLIVGLSAALSGVSMAIEEPEFVLETKNGPLEIRRYLPMLVAETEVQADFDGSGNQAFRILADYIFGNNQTKKNIEMTAPVTQQAASEKIAMTAPVTQIKSKQGYLVQFTMPKEYTLETLPQPNDSRVKLRRIPERKVAVYSYSGSWSQSNYDQHLATFKKNLSAQGIPTKGDPIFARFNSPFSLWFLRRNEIWLELAGRD
jgi:effector-binding domain-containing protein